MSTMSDGTWDDWEEELEEIRRQICEEIRGMTPEEYVAYINAQAEPVMRKFNLKWATLQPVIPRVRRRIGEEVLVRYD